MIVVSGIVASQTTATAADPPDAVPRYRLAVGQELVFKEESNFKYGKAPHQGSIGSRSDWTVWTVRKNDDGSYRLVLRSVERSKFDGKESGEPRSSLAYFDLTTDGRLLPNSTIGFHVNPASIFPRLPADERELRNGWTEFNRQTDAASTFQVQSRPKSAGQVWTIREVRKTPMDEIYPARSRQPSPSIPPAAWPTGSKARALRPTESTARGPVRPNSSRQRPTTPPGAISSGNKPIAFSQPARPTTTK